MPPVGTTGPLGCGVTAARAARSAAVWARALAYARAPRSAVTKVAITTNAHRARPIRDADPCWSADWDAIRLATSAPPVTAGHPPRTRARSWTRVPSWTHGLSSTHGWS